MAVEPVYETMTVDNLSRVCAHQVVVEARLLSQGGVKIAKVLSIVATASANHGETFAGETRFSGKVNFKVVFIDENGANYAVDTTADFNDKIVSELIKAGMKPLLTAHVLDTDTVSVDERELKLAAVVEIGLTAVCSETPRILAKGGEGIYAHDDRLEYARLITQSDGVFVVNSQIQELDMERILFAESRIVTVNRRAGMDAVTVEGNIVCDICGESKDGMIVSARAVTPFTGEIGASAAREGDFVLASAVLSAQSVAIETDGEKSAANLEFTVHGFATVFRPESVAAVTDVFSVTHELKTTAESLTVVLPKFCGTLNERVEGSVSLDIAMPIADTVMAVTGQKLNVAQCTAADGRINIDGIVSANIIYYSAEKNQKASVLVELPFSAAFDRKEVSFGDTVTGTGIVTGITAKILRGSEISLKAEIEIEAVISSASTKTIITGLEIGEELVLPSAAFSVHMAKTGETLWDIAKSLGLTPELILMQNPGLALPLKGGERVIGYRQIKR